MSSKLPKLRKKSKDSKTEKSKENQESKILSAKMTGWEAFIAFVNSRKTKIFFSIVGIIALLILTIVYVHWGIVFGYIVIAPLSFLFYKWMQKKDYVAILQLDPDTWSPALKWATPEYFASLEIKDEPAVLDAEQTQAIEKNEDGDLQIALKGVQPSEDGSRLYVCQDYNPDKDYIEFGWIDNTTPYEFIIQRSKFTQLSDFANSMVEKLKDEQSGARSRAVKDMEEMIKEWGRYPYESDKEGIRDEPDR